MRDERPVVVNRCRELQAEVRNLLSAIARLIPAELGSRWWAGDPELNPSLRAVAERLDRCLARFDALQVALDLPAGHEPRYRRLLGVLDGEAEAPIGPTAQLACEPGILGQYLDEEVVAYDFPAPGPRLQPLSRAGGRWRGARSVKR